LTVWSGDMLYSLSAITFGENLNYNWGIAQFRRSRFVRKGLNRYNISDIWRER
jgi:hypothetical protein